jgi:hypothetical protein
MRTVVDPSVLGIHLSTTQKDATQRLSYKFASSQIASSELDISMKLSISLRGLPGRM